MLKQALTTGAVVAVAAGIVAGSGHSDSGPPLSAMTPILTHAPDWRLFKWSLWRALQFNSEVTMEHRVQSEDSTASQTSPVTIKLPEIAWSNYAFIFNHPEMPSIERRSVEPLLAAISSWLAVEHGVPKVTKFPRVAFVSTEEIWALRYRATASEGTTVSAPSYGTPLPTALAMHYDDVLQTIYLTNLWTGGSPAELSLVVRGMAYHAYAMAVTPAPVCAQDRDKFAYGAQEAWLATSGRSLKEDFGMDSATYMLTTECIP